jgi:iron complex outermembrane recepter protein
VIGEYSRPLNDRMDGYLRGLFTWKGNSVNDPVNAFDDVPGYGILNLYAGLRASNGAWEMSLYGKNITNTFRVLTRSNGPSVTSLRAGIPLGPPPVVSSGPIAGSYYGITVTEPREFGINLRFAFGSR